MRYQYTLPQAEMRLHLDQSWSTDMGQRSIDDAVFDGIIAGTAPMKLCRALVMQAAAHTQPVWLLGEQGTGRHLLAQCMHVASARAHAPFVRLRCREMQADAMQRVILGSSDMPGLLQRSIGGTLYIEDAEYLSPWEHALLADMFSDTLHAKMPNRQLPRLILSSGIDLRERMADWYWLQQLFRITVPRPLMLPSLRARLEDLPALAERMLMRLAPLSATLPPRGFTPRALRWMHFQPWSGNLVELRTQLKHAIAQYDANPSDNRQIDAHHLTVAAM